jgi:two-component system, LytTR family, response regulator
MINALIIDDEQKARYILNEFIQQHCPSVNIVGMADSVENGFEAIKRYNPNLLFLDIEMPFGTGFDLLEKVRDINIDVVFTTAYDHYAIKAIKFSALDYLLKPINLQELKQAVSKVEARLSDKLKYSSQIELLLLNSKQARLPRKIALPGMDGLSFINIDDIICCMADGSYTNISLVDKEKLLISKSLPGPYKKIYKGRRWTSRNEQWRKNRRFYQAKKRISCQVEYGIAEN